MSNYYNAASATVGVTVAKISVTKPSLAATTVYTTGSAVGPTIKNYNSSLMTQSGTTSTSTLGTYRLTWTLKDTSKYQWSDGTTGAYSIDWTCAGGTISITWKFSSSNGRYYGSKTLSLTYRNKWSDYYGTSGFEYYSVGTNSSYSIGTYTMLDSQYDSDRKWWFRFCVTSDGSLYIGAASAKHWVTANLVSSAGGSPKNGSSFIAYQ